MPGKEDIRIVILAGGFGTRLSEETILKPKPMVEIGGKPIIEHIMGHYAGYGYKNFYVALGYRGWMIKRFFYDYHVLQGSLCVDMKKGTVNKLDLHTNDWVVHLMETGSTTKTGGRVKRLETYLNDGTFMVTYGDGVSDIDLDALLAFHKSHGKLATVTAVRPPARFGGLEFDGNQIVKFTEKPQIGEGWINGGYLVFEPGIFNYLNDDEASLEVDLMERLSEDGEIMAYRHEGYWQCMDTIRDKNLLEDIWSKGAPWKH